MDNNQKKFNLYVFLSTFARNLIEIFIPIILYKSGFSLKQVIFYYFILNTFSAIITIFCVKFANKSGYRKLSIIGIISFIILQILLNNIKINILYLILTAIFYSTYRRCYWISRKFFSLKIIKKDNISKTYSFIIVCNQIAEIVGSYIGALLLDFIDIKVLTLISVILFLSSLIPLKKLDIQKSKNPVKIDLVKTIKKIPFEDIYIFCSYELLNATMFLFPLYLYIYVKNNYSVVGLLALITNTATIIFALIYGKKVNKKKNYLSTSIFLRSIVYILKLNVTSLFLIVVSFIEGIVIKMNQISLNKEFFQLSKNYEYENYNLVYNFLETAFRAIIVLFLLLFINDLKVMIYITIFIFASSGFVKFKYKKK